MADNDVAVLAVKIDALKDSVEHTKTIVDKLAESAARQSVIEERQLQTSTALDRAFSALSRHSERLEKLEKTGAVSNRTTLWFDRVIWLAVLGVLMMAAKKLGMT